MFLKQEASKLDENPRNETAKVVMTTVKTTVGVVDWKGPTGAGRSVTRPVKHMSYDTTTENDQRRYQEGPLPATVFFSRGLPEAGT